jgi:hypothetical protein
MRCFITRKNQKEQGPSWASYSQVSGTLIMSLHSFPDHESSFFSWSWVFILFLIMSLHSFADHEYMYILYLIMSLHSFPDNESTFFLPWAQVYIHFLIMSLHSLPWAQVFMLFLIMSLHSQIWNTLILTILNVLEKCQLNCYHCYHWVRMKFQLLFILNCISAGSDQVKKI